MIGGATRVVSAGHDEPIRATGPEQAHPTSGRPPASSESTLGEAGLPQGAEWTHAWREDLCLRYAEVLTALVAAREAEGDRLAAARVATRLVELDPLDEGAQRTLIACYARCGRRGHALRQYLECRRRLIDDLGVEPARQTSELQRRVLAGEPV